jgi:hypothetical protein
MLGGCLGLIFRIIVDALVTKITVRVVNWLVGGHLVELIIRLLALIGIRVRKLNK